MSGISQTNIGIQPAGSSQVSVSAGLLSTGTGQTIVTGQQQPAAPAANTETTIIAAGGKSLYVTQFSFVAQNAAGCDIVIEDGAGGTQVYKFWWPVTATAGQPLIFVFPSPLKFATGMVLKNIAAISSFYYCSAVGYTQ